MSHFMFSSPKTYRALTGLENADGVRVEQGELLPADFVPQAQIDAWLADHDIQDISDFGMRIAEFNASNANESEDA